MNTLQLRIDNYRQLESCEIVIGDKVTAIAGNNGTDKSAAHGLLANSQHFRRYKRYLGGPFRGDFPNSFPQRDNMARPAKNTP